MARKLEVYVHVPFCVKKCLYCDFLSFGSVKEQKIAQYFTCLRDEIRFVGERMTCENQYEVTSVFFGGGTPSAVDASKITEVLGLLKETFHFVEEPEISIEVNPGTVTEEKLRAYKEVGINRISFGLQSAHDQQLQLLGRIHTFEQFEENYRLARNVGFCNINVDLMSGLPGQSVDSWRQSLERVLELQPEHLSAYSLIIEPGTPFYDRYEEDDMRRAEGEQPRELPSEEEERQMVHLTKELLRARGYVQYEISNYAKPGYACRHNDGYWLRTEYVGFGLGAASLLDSCRLQNTTDMSLYCDGKGLWQRLREETRLSLQEVMEETMFLGLRRVEGVSRAHFLEQTGCELDQVYGNIINKFVAEGLMEDDGIGVRLTDAGLDVANYCMSEFLEPLEGTEDE